MHFGIYETVMEFIGFVISNDIEIFKESSL